ncbi:ATP-binding protein [uncultured Paludibaculum sp.]|uniref:ATP-binding protein n=1 Tax=uncultured Paludibaculum sp. TaxID=1765020 RepID=UPI002AABED8A|nr:ATP-binding protein [uncultured Paludibaculum sp.]
MSKESQIEAPGLEREPENISPFSLARVFDAPRGVIIAWTIGISLAIAALDVWIDTNVSIGMLYLIPMLLVSFILNRGQIIFLGLVYSLLREHLAPFGWELESVARIGYAVIGFAGAGLFANEVVRSRRMALQYSRELQEQIQRRKEAEGQLRTLIESSPAAIITLDADGRVDLANQAAHELLVLPMGSLYGERIRKYLPVMADLLQANDGDLPYRTATNARGRRANGESFLACVWFATYPTRAGKRLAAIITDASDDLRDWQETSLQNLLRSTRVLVGSVSHEIRNVCAAIAVVHANLGRIPGVAQSEDYTALGTLAQGLARLATVELHSAGDQEVGTSNLETLLEEFRIVVEPTLDAEEIKFELDIPEGLPPVVGDHHGLLQVFLNLSRNSVRAMENAERRDLRVTARLHGPAVEVRFQDSGPGVKNPERLFQAFQQGADAVGLGLFVSRAIVRASEGELYHEPSETGCTMCVRLKPHLAPEPAGELQNTEITA